MIDQYEIKQLESLLGKATVEQLALISKAATYAVEGAKAMTELDQITKELTKENKNDEKKQH